MARYDAAADVRAFQTPRYRMTYRVLGKGPALFVLPGIAGTHQCYAMLLNRLAESFQTILVTYPGDEPGDGARLGRITHQHLAADTLALLSHLDLARAYLLGISFGSTVAFSMLAQAPDRFVKAVVQGAFAARRYTPAERLTLALGKRFPGTVRSLPFRERVLTWNCQADFSRPIRDRWPLFLEQHARTRVAALAHRCGLLAGLDLRGVLPKVAAQVLVIQGNEDRVVPKRYYEEVIALLSKARGCVLPVVGHPIHITHPEREAALVTEFFSADRP